LPTDTVTVDIHCVTRWSKLDTTWEGVSLDTLLEGVETEAEYATAFCDGGYTTNLPLEDLTDGKAWVAYTYDGEPLDPEHGGPARLLVPHLYFWKSAKWVRGLRLTATDEPVNGQQVELTVEEIDDGEVSPYLTAEARAGDELEIRGPVGGYFVWDSDYPNPVLLVGGGSGVVPLMAMIRQRGAVPTTLVYSARALEDVIYRDELERLAGGGLDVVLTLTRAQPEGWAGHSRRVDAELLAEVAPPPEQRPLAFVCGPTPFVEAVALALVDLGHDPGLVKTERFGPTGT
jgi:DMSO/TMAO reductase YedYZ molybdopterin-dependent catalytic subunit